PKPGSDDDGQYLFHLGRTSKAAFPQNWQLGHGLPFDLPRVDSGSHGNMYGSGQPAITPLVNDDRNDDNLILAQLTAQFLLAHNAVASYLRRNGDPTHGNRKLDGRASFEVARHFLLKAYRQIVVHDHLPKLLLPDVHADLMNGRIKTQDRLPVEFVFGAARTGHAMVRNIYAVNAHIDLESSRLGRLMAFSSSSPNPNLPLPADWAADWSGLVEMPASGKRPASTPQSARRMSPFLAPTFVYGQLKGRRTGIDGSLSFHDLWRCYQFGIPTGQDCARRAFPKSPQKVLQGAEMLPPPAFQKLHPADKLIGALNANRGFLSETPLSYYLFQEAAVLGGNGRFLGPLGSHIFATAILHALQVHPQPPHGQRALTLGAIMAGNGVKTLPEFLGIAAQSDVELAETIAVTLQ
ncbi:MAG TPA: peroxidase family protein, partial [Dongiaceae bacterium]